MKKSLLILSLFIAAQTTENTAFAQAVHQAATEKKGTIKGKITADNGTPVEAAIVKLKGTKFGTVTQEDGSYYLSVPEGKYTLEANVAGSPLQSTTIDVTAGQTIAANITLNTTINHHLGDVVVTGQYAPQSVRNSVYQVRTINQQTIKMRGATTVLDVLNTQLGFRFIPDNTLGETSVRMMGLDAAYVKVLLDGIPLTDRDASKQVLTQIDINSIEKIEIVEGPMSAVYGTDALGGVINIITKKAGRKPNLTIAARIQEESAGDTYSAFTDDGIHNENLSIAWNNEHWQLSGYGTRNNFGGFRDTATFPAKVFKPKDQWLTGGTAGYRNNKVSVWYRLDYVNEDIFAAAPMTSINTSLQQHYYTNRYTHQLQTDWRLNSKLNINTSVSYQNYKRNTETYTYNYATNTEKETTGSGYWDVSTMKSWFFRSTAQWAINSKLAVQPGVDIKYDKASGDRISGTPDITDYSFFATAEIKPTTGINIKPGIRITKNAVYDAPPVIPTLNTKFVLNKNFDLRLSYGRGFRAPILRELYFDFRDANHFIIGNPNLKAETSNSYTASLTWQNANASPVRLTASLNVFYNDLSNAIVFVQGTDVDPISGQPATTYANISKSKNTGTTLNTSVTWKNLSASAGFSYIAHYNDYKDESTLKGDHSTFSWAPEANSNITYRLPKWKTELGVFYKFTGAVPSYVLDGNGNIAVGKLEAYHWADFTATKHFLKYFAVQAGIKNIFDVQRLSSTAASGGAHSGGTMQNYAYGRSYFIGLNIQWSRN